MGQHSVNVIHEPKMVACEAISGAIYIWWSTTTKYFYCGALFVGFTFDANRSAVADHVALQCSQPVSTLIGGSRFIDLA